MLMAAEWHWPRQSYRRAVPQRPHYELQQVYVSLRTSALLALIYSIAWLTNGTQYYYNGKVINSPPRYSEPSAEYRFIG